MKARIKCVLSKSLPKIALFLLCPLAVFLFLFAALPRTAYIYYAGAIDSGAFLVTAESNLELDIDGSSNLGFERQDKGDILVEDTESSSSYTFTDGTATLFASEGLELTVASSDGKPFQYELLLESEAQKDGEAGCIKFSKLSDNAQILLRPKGTRAIHMKGSQEEIPAAKYSIHGCDTIEVNPAGIKPLGDLSGGRKISRSVSSFSLLNAKRNTLEATIMGQTEFRKIGRGVLTGTAAAEQLTFTVCDTAQIPFPVELSGTAKELSLSGYSLLPNWIQWLYENRSEIALAFISAFFASFFFPRIGKKKEEAEK